ncbi:MAG TPA: hypothetical protein VNE17_03800 [Nitrolancea sp.]|nr:hypothetical protein [Nitrolancea sp.]
MAASTSRRIGVIADTLAIIAARFASADPFSARHRRMGGSLPTGYRSRCVTYLLIAWKDGAAIAMTAPLGLT